MSSLPIWVLDSAAEGADRPFSLFGPKPTERIFEPAFERSETRRTASHPRPRHELKSFERLFGTLSLADLNEYRVAAGLDPELDARALRALNRAADRYFPARNDDSGGRFLRNTYLKYLSEHADVAAIPRGSDEGFGPF